MTSGWQAVTIPRATPYQEHRDPLWFGHHLLAASEHSSPRHRARVAAILVREYSRAKMPFFEDAQAQTQFIREVTLRCVPSDPPDDLDAALVLVNSWFDYADAHVQDCYTIEQFTRPSAWVTLGKYMPPKLPVGSDPRPLRVVRLLQSHVRIHTRLECVRQGVQTILRDDFSNHVACQPAVAEALIRMVQSLPVESPGDERDDAPLYCELVAKVREIAALANWPDSLRQTVQTVLEARMGNPWEDQDDLQRRADRLFLLAQSARLILDHGLSREPKEELHSHFAIHYRKLLQEELRGIERQAFDLPLRRFILCFVEYLQQAEKALAIRRNNVREYQVRQRQVDQLWQLVIKNRSERSANPRGTTVPQPGGRSEPWNLRGAAADELDSDQAIIQSATLRTWNAIPRSSVDATETRPAGPLLGTGEARCLPGAEYRPTEGGRGERTGGGTPEVSPLPTILQRVCREPAVLPRALSQIGFQPADRHGQSVLQPFPGVSGRELCDRLGPGNLLAPQGFSDLDPPLHT